MHRESNIPQNHAIPTSRVPPAPDRRGTATPMALEAPPSPVMFTRMNTTPVAEDGTTARIDMEASLAVCEMTLQVARNLERDRMAMGRSTPSK